MEKLKSKPFSPGKKQKTIQGLPISKRDDKDPEAMDRYHKRAGHYPEEVEMNIDEAKGREWRPGEGWVDKKTGAERVMSRLKKKHADAAAWKKKNKKNSTGIEEAKIKVKLNPKKKIGYELSDVGPGGKKKIVKRKDMPGKKDIGEWTPPNPK